MASRSVQSHITTWQFQDLTVELRHNSSGTVSSLPPHLHEEYQFILAETMTGEYAYRRGRHLTPTGSLLVIHPGEVHSARGLVDAQPHLPLRTFYARPALLKRAAEAESRSGSSLPFFPAPVILDQQTFHAFRRLHHLLEETASTLEQETEMLHTFTRLAQRHAEERCEPRTPGREHRAVQQARDYLTTHYAEDVSLTRLADMTGLSAYHLCRVFCREAGLPPHSYQTQQRIARARTLLAQGQAIGSVALDTGFADQAHFTRKFKRLVGVTPGNYRARHSAGQECPLPNSNNVQDENLPLTLH